MRCQAMRRVRDITATVILVCDLEADHAEEYHHDKFNRLMWMAEKPDEKVPAKPVDNPSAPQVYKYNPVAVLEPIPVLEAVA